MRHSSSAWLIAILYALLASGCSVCGSHTQTTPAHAAGPAFEAGYLPTSSLPDSLFLLPPPPAPMSAAMALDDDISRRSLSLRGSPRWTLAAQDAVLAFPAAAAIFSCALDAPVTEQDTPHLYTLLRKSLSDAGRSTGKAKQQYRRPRPFMVNREPICTPDEEKKLVTSGSYPSGHASAGWAWALILAEIAPERGDAILARGRAFGESRVVCNVHWHSDVVEGRIIGAATVARLHADPAFRADVAAAKEELSAVRAKGLKPQRNCAAETAALAGERQGRMK